MATIHARNATQGGTPSSYALGNTDAEHDRLIRQAAYLAPVTERLFREAGIGPGHRVLELGSGVGDVAMLVAGLVGPTGQVIGEILIQNDSKRIGNHFAVLLSGVHRYLVRSSAEKIHALQIGPFPSIRLHGSYEEEFGFIETYRIPSEFRNNGGQKEVKQAKPFWPSGFQNVWRCNAPVRFLRILVLSVPVHHTHLSLPQKMQSSESTGGNLRLSTSCSAPSSRTSGRHATKVYGQGSRHCYAIRFVSVRT